MNAVVPVIEQMLPPDKYKIVNWVASMVDENRITATVFYESRLN
jgi:hypothetical protein